ncbi:hypothetical protein METHB2_650016 [Candidatus Methylobacter favarea]|uniref:Uncharacterized protein n=1 Tax=Candidatus Methylobacter favarea TaxID=2707345 RepID=A0A8S0XUD1_9GAMM|nr:hypothetical protein [Candidatus Methylobacter favarea]CAA9892328.1 hypothetical protein METHB2_650016 [Candidatus Methylobacter favarea]
MEKERILRQLEDKLLPSVQTLARNEASEHDFFPALLWMLLEKSKDSENLLKESGTVVSDQLNKAVSFILTKNQDSDIKLEQLLKINEENINEHISKTTTTIKNDSNISQEKTEKLFESKYSLINQQIEEIKNTQLKMGKKFSVWFLVFSIFQITILATSAVILIKSL